MRPPGHAAACIAAIVAAGLLAACTAGASGKRAARPPADSRTPAGAQLYAFAGQEGLAVAQGERILHRAAAASVLEVQWTRDGRFAFAVDRADGGAAVDQIVALDAATGATIVRRCDCMSAAAVGGSDILWIDQKGRANRLSLADRSVEAHGITIAMPQGVIPQQVFTGVGGTYPMLATTRGSEWDDRSGALYEVQADGSGRLLRDLQSVNNVTLMVAHAGPQGVQYLYGVIIGQGDCAHPGPVYLTDPQSREGVATDVTEVLGGQSPEVADAAISDGWWGADGVVYGTLSSWICDPNGGTTVKAPQIWKLDGRRWVPFDTAAVSFRDLPSGGRLMVDTERVLYLQTATGRVRIAAGIRSVEPQPSTGR